MDRKFSGCLRLGRIADRLFGSLLVHPIVESLIENGNASFIFCKFGFDLTFTLGDVAFELGNASFKSFPFGCDNLNIAVNGFLQ